jgi:peptidylprolyl isomerase
MMTLKVEKNKFVSVAYTGTFENGDVFDTSSGSHPLEVRMGAGDLIEGFEKELDGMTLNEKKKFSLEPEDAYGIRDESLIQSFPRSEIPPEMNPEVGMAIGFRAPDGRHIPATISEVGNESIVVDLNHPMAGKKLNFEIEVVGISDTPSQIRADCGSDCDCDSGCGCSSGCR